MNPPVRPPPPTKGGMSMSFATLKRGALDGLRPPMNHSGTLSRFVGGLARWKDREMSLDSNRIGRFTIPEGPTLVLSANPKVAFVEVLWVYEDKGGQKFQFTITDVHQAKELFQVASLAELDKWLEALQSHNCKINRPIRMDALHLVKEKRDSWVILYPNSLRYFKNKTDSKPHWVVPISEGSILERLDQDSFCLSETGDEQAVSISLAIPEGVKGFYEAVEQAVSLKSQKKSADSLHEGYVWLCVKGGSSFKKRLCVLYPDGIKYFKKRFDDQAAGTIRLPPGSHLEVVAEDMGSRKNIFWVAENGDESGTQHFFFSTKSPAERTEWVHILGELFFSKDCQVEQGSLFEGYVYKRSSKWVWKKKFCVLFPDSLQYSARRNDTVRKSIDLNQGLQLKALKPNQNDPVMNQPGLLAIAENGDEGTRIFMFHFQNDEVRTEWMDIMITLLSTKNLRINPRSFKEGYMQTKGKGKNEWKKRYCILLDQKLLHSRKRNDQSEATEVKITAATEIAELEGTQDNKYLFSLAETGDEQEVSFQFGCTSADVRTQWINAIIKRVKALDSKVVPDSILEGYLWILKGGASEKRYFILKQGSLSFYKKRADKVEAGSLEIKGEAEICLLEDEEHPFSFSIAKSGDAGEKQFILFCRDSETRYEWVSKLRAQVARLASKESQTSIREGYVYTLKVSDDSWRKRYFVLEPDCLNLFAKRKDVKPVQKMPLDKDVIILLLDKNATFDSHASKDAVGEEADEGGEEEEKDRKIAGLQMVLCKNGDPGAKQLRLKGANDSEAMLVADLMEICLRKEFPQVSESILKSGYVVAYQESGLLKASRWVSSFVILKASRLLVLKSCEDEIPVSVVSLEEAKIVEEPGSLAVRIIDRTAREVNLMPQSEDEKKEWLGPITRAIAACNDKNEISRVKLFGFPLKAAVPSSPYYQIPSVIGVCIDFLVEARTQGSTSGCLFRHPGLHPLVRSFVQDFESGFLPTLRDKDSVAACLKLYLTMLPKPIISSNVVEEISVGNVSSAEKAVEDMDLETRTTLNILLHYLDNEIKQPEEVDLTMEQVTQTWAPILMQTKQQDDKKIELLAFLIQNIKAIFPSGPIVRLKRLPSSQLQDLKAQPTTFEQLFQDPYGLDLFAQFVKENYLDENFLFLKATRKYREMCTSAQFGAAQRLAAAEAIINAHIKQGAEKQCNISAALSKEIQTQFSAAQNKKLNGNEFAGAEMEVSFLESTNSFPRFQKTDAYDQWIVHRYTQTQSAPKVSFRRSTVTRPNHLARPPPPLVSSLSVGSLRSPRAMESRPVRGPPEIKTDPSSADQKTAPSGNNTPISRPVSPGPNRPVSPGPNRPVSPGPNRPVSPPPPNGLNTPTNHSVSPPLVSPPPNTQNFPSRAVSLPPTPTNINRPPNPSTPPRLPSPLTVRPPPPSPARRFGTSPIPVKGNPHS